MGLLGVGLGLEALDFGVALGGTIVQKISLKGLFFIHNWLPINSVTGVTFV